MRKLDFSSWQGILTTFLCLAVFTLLGVGMAAGGMGMGMGLSLGHDADEQEKHT